VLFDGLPIGTVPYLNAVPLTNGLEEPLVRLPPSQLATEFRADRLAAALLSVTEALTSPDIDVLDGFAIACHGPVYSVILAHQDNLEDMQEIAVDTASCTSVNLLRVLLDLWGLRPKLVPWADYANAGAARNFLLIGNPAIQFRRQAHPHRVLDLGSAWWALTGLPFVFAVWVLHHGRHGEPLRAALTAAGRSGVRQLDRWSAESKEFDAGFRRRYLGGYIRYGLGEPEKAGLNHFRDALQRLEGRPLHAIRYVGS